MSCRIGLVSAVACRSRRRWPVVAVGWVCHRGPRCRCGSPPVVVPLSPRGCWVMVSLAASVNPHRPIAPSIRPASSRSQWWRWVAGVLVIGPPLLLSFASSSSPVLVVLPLLSFTCPHCHDDGAVSTRNPPCEQGCSPSSFSSPRSRCCCCWCCCCPVVPAVIVSPFCCCCPCRPPPRSSSFLPLAPAIHPASSCSQRQGGAGSWSRVPGCWCWCHVPCPLRCGQAAPMIHPTSSCSLAWGRVPGRQCDMAGTGGWGCVPGGSLLGAAPAVPHHSRSPPSPSLLSAISTLSTLRAVARSGGDRVPVVSSLVGCFRTPIYSLLLASLSFHPQPTPQAVAREAGGGWCGVVHRPPPSLVPPVVVAAIPPKIHPTSSCSWCWGQVVCRPSCGAGAGVVGCGTRRAHGGRWGDVASSTRTTLRASACSCS